MMTFNVLCIDNYYDHEECEVPALEIELNTSLKV